MSGWITARSMLRRRRPEAGDDRGAAAVEFALVSLLLVTLFLGIIEFSLILRDKVAVTSAVRAGGRLASAEARTPPYPAGSFVASATGTPTTVTGLVPDAVLAVSTNLTGIPKTSIAEVWVFQASANGFPVGTTSFATCPPTNCVRYIYSSTRPWHDPVTNTDVVGGFSYQSGTWDYTTINACIGTQQSVGIYLKVNHGYLFSLFGTGNLGITDSSSFRFEPIPSSTGACS